MRRARFGAAFAAPAIELLFAGDGWVAAGYQIVWQIALFLSLGRDFIAYGGALAVAALVGAVGGLLLGRHIDARAKARPRGPDACYAIGTIAFVIAVLRAAVLQLSRARDHGECARRAGGLPLHLPTMMTAVYNQAKRSRLCALRFQVFAEGGWDIGMTLGCHRLRRRCAGWRGSAAVSLAVAILARRCSA